MTLPGEVAPTQTIPMITPKFTPTIHCTREEKLGSGHGQSTRARCAGRGRPHQGEQDAHCGLTHGYQADGELPKRYQSDSLQWMRGLSTREPGTFALRACDDTHLLGDCNDVQTALNHLPDRDNALPPPDILSNTQRNPA